MFVSSEIVFNQVDFDRRLRRYFFESAPCVVSYSIGLDYVTVSAGTRNITVELSRKLSEEENSRLVIDECEKSL